MNFMELFELLRAQKYILYVPERIYCAHTDGLLRGWGAGWRNQHRLFDLLEEQNVNIRIPFPKPNDIDMDEKWIVEHRADRVALYEKREECPPFPETVVASDKFWDSFLDRFGLRGTVTNKILASYGWVHRVRFFTLWTSVQRVGSNSRKYDLPATERQEIRDSNRILRKDYGLTLTHYCNVRRATLVVLKKAYPPEQVNRVRRQLEEKLRKDPAEAIRYAIERKLVK